MVLTDVRMSELGGLELAQILRRAKQPSIKIIGVSAGAMDRDRQACLDAGMDDHLSKPFKANDLLDKIQQHA